MEFCLSLGFMDPPWVKLLSCNIFFMRASNAYWKMPFNFGFSSPKSSKFAEILNYDFNVLKGHWYLQCSLLLMQKFKAQHILNRLSEEVEHPACSAASCSWEILFCCTILIILIAATTSRNNRELVNKNQIKEWNFLWENIWMLSLSVVGFHDRHGQKWCFNVSLIFYSLSSHSSLIGVECLKKVDSG